MTLGKMRFKFEQLDLTIHEAGLVGCQQREIKLILYTQEPALEILQYLWDLNHMDPKYYIHVGCNEI